jgi:hypothetical protein
MAVKKNNPHVQKMLTLAKTINTDSGAPFFGMVEALAFAVADKAITQQSEFKDLIQSLRTETGRATLAENRLSETWSCGELGEYTCVKPLFKAMRALPSLPTMTGLYDITCSIREKGSFANSKTKQGDNAGKGLAWDKVRVDAPTTAQLQAAMKFANQARNKGKVQKSQTFAEYLEAVIKRLTKESTGYTVTRDDKKVSIPANTSAALKSAIELLGKVRDEGKVSIPHAKIAARRKNIAASKSNGSKAAA